MPVRRLPSNPNLDHLKYQAKDLLKEHSAAPTPGVAQRIREFHPRFARASDAERAGDRNRRQERACNQGRSTAPGGSPRRSHAAILALSRRELPRPTLDFLMPRTYKPALS